MLCVFAGGLRLDGAIASKGGLRISSAKVVKGKLEISLRGRAAKPGRRVLVKWDWQGGAAPSGSKRVRVPPGQLVTLRIASTKTEGAARVCISSPLRRGRARHCTEVSQSRPSAVPAAVGFSLLLIAMAAFVYYFVRESESGVAAELGKRIREGRQG